MSDGATRAPATAALERELEALHDRSFGWALACCSWDREEAADVLQATYVKVLDGTARFEGRSQLSTWLYGVIRRTASERRRRRTRRLRLLAGRPAGALEPLHAPDDAPERGVDGAREAKRLRAALRALPARQREVLHLVFYAELTIREAADVMGVRLGTARVHYERGKKRLREALALEETR